MRQHAALGRVGAQPLLGDAGIVDIWQGLAHTAVYRGGIDQER